ncbi:MAG: DNA alkylation repair protein [Lachnospiraceae bacterium]|nr:DNA alkylation repair protein [Lachnospiraceae bacterium]
MTEIQKELFQLQDKEYRQFHSSLMPTIDPDLVIGVRTPELRKLAKRLGKEKDISIFLGTLPHTYYEENNLHAFIISEYKDYAACIEALDAFLPYVDNWATCDMMVPGVLKKDLPKTMDKIREWLSSEKTYTIRFGLGMIMRFYLEDAFDTEYLTMVASVTSEEYYVKMMIAWLFATALAKQYKATIPFIEQRCLEPWTHRKAIQKAIESRRITEEQKQYLRTLK